MVYVLGTLTAMLVAWNSFGTAWQDAGGPIPATRGYVIQKVGEVETKISGPIRELQIASIDGRLRDLEYREGRIRGEQFTRRKELTELPPGPARDIVENRLMELDVERERVISERDQLQRDLRQLKK